MRIFTIFIIAASALMLSTETTAAETGSFVTSSDKVAPYANTQTLGRRMLDGLVYQEMVKNAAKDNVDLTRYPVDPRAEKWQVYVPATPGDNDKYGLLVWITDQDEFAAPESWQKILDEQHIIFISPINAGEDEDMIFRRAAMGLLGLNWALSNYSLDASTLLVGGDGSGANVAEGLALAYGDIFTGALLANTEEIDGARPVPTPHPAITERIATRSRFVVPANSDNAAFIDMMNADLCVASSSINTSPAANGMPERLEAPLAFLRIREQNDQRECLVQQRIAANKAIKEVKANLENSKIVDAVDGLLAAHNKFGILIETDVMALSTEMREKYAREYRQAAEIFQRSNALTTDYEGLAAKAAGDMQNPNNNK